MDKRINAGADRLTTDSRCRTNCGAPSYASSFGLLKPCDVQRMAHRMSTCNLGGHQFVQYILRKSH
jgi:hypothetical protein